MKSARSGLTKTWRRWGELDRLVRAMIVNWAFGMATGVFCALLLLAFDFFGLRSLLWRSDVAITGVAMLCAAFAFTFGGVVCAAAVMSVGADEETTTRPRGLRLRTALRSRLAPAAVALDPSRRRD
ncbi:MAG: hypothetical protein ABSC25_19190 [Roseiarcus sp.]|jgi:hypothetical protein